MHPIYIDFLNGPDIAALDISNAEILEAIEASLAIQGRGEAVIEPRMHLIPGGDINGHFNVLRGVLGGDIGYAGVKVVGDFVDNYRKGLPSELAILNLLDPATGIPKAILDASAITDMRTGAVTAIGAKYLARPDSKVLAHIGARGTAYWNVRLLDHLFDFEEIRVHSRRSESREAFAQRLRQDLGKPVIVTDDWESAVRGADIVVEASRLDQPEPLLHTDWIKTGAFVVPYGTMSAVQLSLTDIMSKLVVRLGPVQRRDVWRTARACRCRQAQCRHPARRAWADCRRLENRPRKPGRNHSVLAPWPEPQRHRPGPCTAGKSPAIEHRPAAALGMISFDPQGLALADLLAIARHDTPAQFSAQARQRIDEGHRLLLKRAAEGTPIYGVTTGLGAAVDTPVSPLQ